MSLHLGTGILHKEFFNNIFWWHNYYYYFFRSLCDIKGLGKLNSEQFALAMYLINLKMKGVDPPTQLTPEMIPPSMRSGTDTAAFGITVSINNRILSFTCYTTFDWLTFVVYSTVPTGVICNNVLHFQLTFQGFKMFSFKRNFPTLNKKKITILVKSLQIQCCYSLASALFSWVQSRI